MSDLKTTVTGAVAGACQLVAMFVPGAAAFCEPVSGLALVLLGWFAKDKA